MDMKAINRGYQGRDNEKQYERTSPEVISAAYAVVYLIGGVLLASRRAFSALRAVRHGGGGGVGCRA